MMNIELLHQFYEHAVLPQFGLQSETILWDEHVQTVSDEAIHYFSMHGEQYALIFEDYDGLGRGDEFIREYVLERHTAYEFVEPTAATGSAPTYDGFRLPAPSRYVEGITGSFTLLRLLKEAA